MAQQAPDRALLKEIDLSFAEAALLCEALRALWLSPQFIERTWREMRDIIRAEGLEQRWGTTADVLIKHLAGRRRAEATAILRAAIRFWERPEEPTAKLLNELGLIRLRRRGPPKASRSRNTSRQ